MAHFNTFSNNSLSSLFAVTWSVFQELRLKRKQIHNKKTNKMVSLDRALAPGTTLTSQVRRFAGNSNLKELSSNAGRTAEFCIGSVLESARSAYILPVRLDNLRFGRLPRKSSTNS